MVERLDRALQDQLGKTSPVTVTTSCEVFGMAVGFIVTRRKLECEIDCIFYRDSYYTVFRRDGKNVASADTRSELDLLSAVSDWLDGKPHEELFESYAFVDGGERALRQIREEMVKRHPDIELQFAEDFSVGFGSYCRLRITTGERSCEISHEGISAIVHAKFSWDECYLFEHNPDDHAQLIPLLSRWICDGAMPSEMRAEFPELEIGFVADYYEKGNPIEGEFIASWMWIEQSLGYRDNDLPDSISKTSPRYLLEQQICQFGEAMRERGYHRTLRTDAKGRRNLVLSRSRRASPRFGNPNVYFKFPEQGMSISYNENSQHIKTKFETIELTSEVEAILQRLVEQPVV